MAYTTTSVSTIRFDHIAIAVPRIAEATPFLVGELGGVPAYGAPAGAYRFGQWRFDGGGRLEILEPLGEDGFLHRFLARHGPGIHHVTFRVPRLREACERAQARPRPGTPPPADAAGAPPWGGAAPPRPRPRAAGRPPPGAGGGGRGRRRGPRPRGTRQRPPLPLDSPRSPDAPCVCDRSRTW